MKYAKNTSEVGVLEREILKRFSKAKNGQISKSIFLAKKLTAHVLCFLLSRPKFWSGLLCAVLRNRGFFQKVL